MTQNKSSKKASTKSRTGKVRLIGKGDYSQSVLDISKPLPRLEAKIDHLERSLVHAAKTNIGSAASTIGRTLGNFVNQGDLGALAGQGLAKLFGHGDYTVKQNSLMGPGAQAMVPKFSKDGPRGTRIVEREYIGTVMAGTLTSGSTVFNNTSYYINPTNADTFPWLSNIAPLFDQWQPNGIVFEFVSSSSEYNGSSQALGEVIMATDYDPYDSPYVTKVVMENADYACMTKPSCSLVHGVECDASERLSPLFYTNTTGAIPVTQTTLGNFQLATQGCSVAGITLGDLWISYDITFYKKQLNIPPPPIPVLSIVGTSTIGTGYWSNTTGTFAQNTITQSQIIGTGSVINLNNSQLGTYYQVNYSRDITNTLDDFILSYSNCTAISSNYVTNSPTKSIICTTVMTTGLNATITSDLVFGTSPWELLVTQIATGAQF